ncbi:hsp70-like protein [Phytophthora infestans T30-4]|uniref:Hsp70-like protein n=1 Tax=Phytophthora infestans (strain T30-4) TaxID=403677 RepID=D0P491_PHYIT|nr:hsp70-like protein [Phytophthora infestans T30-4]EEY63457.1 hsp70-like protein [Phytophthora infestans T30-4]|eukprot:XP_002894884.1 hsp70-like protein [Phytophthora infestans T30-4]
MVGVNPDSRQGKSPHDFGATSDSEFTPPTMDEISETASCSIGIDFGRSKCEAAVVSDTGSVILIPLEPRSTENCYSLSSFAGHSYTVYDLTMLLGQKTETLSAQDVDRWAFTPQAGAAGKAVVESPAKGNVPDLVYPEQVAALLFATIKNRAETFTGKRVTTAVVTVPAAFNRTQRQAVWDACRIANLDVERLVISSTASAVANADSVIDAAAAVFEKTIVVVDCGAGSLNVTLARVREADGPSSSIEVEVAATAGNLELGGEALTDRLFEHFHSEAKVVDTSSKSTSPAFSRRLRRACMLAQRILSTSQQAAIDLPWQPRRTCGSGAINGVMTGFSSSIWRAEFESLCGSETWDCLPNTVEQVLATAKVKKEDVDAVLVTGGAMQVPKLREVLGDCFAEHWNRIVDLPKHTAAIGAAMIAAQSSGRVLKNETTPLSLGIRSSSGDTLIVVPPSSTVPTRQAQLYYASCQREIKFDILEGLVANRTAGATPNRLEHCLGRILIDGRRASSPFILKLEIAFELDATGELEVVISDKSNDRVTRLLVSGDETCLQGEAITLAQTSLAEALHCAADSGNTSLKPLVMTNGLSVCIPPGDLFLLRSRIEHASAWLGLLDASHISSQELLTARDYLRQIRMLHLSSTANSALVQLRQEMNLFN